MTGGARQKMAGLLVYYWPKNILGGSVSGGQTAPLLTSKPRAVSALNDPFHHHAFDMGNRFGRVQTLRAGLGAVHDGVATVELERIFQFVQTLAGRFVATVDNPPVRMQKGSWPQIPVTVPPVRWA